MSLIILLKEATVAAVKDLYDVDIDASEISINQTKQEFEGDYTVVLFPLLKKIKRGPEQLGKEIGAKLVERDGKLFNKYNVIKGFLNLSVADDYYLEFLETGATAEKQSLTGAAKKIMVEYSSPNTNKPLHLGHLRNIFLGWSVGQIFKELGNDVMKTCIVNDRGIHICKSMIAWEQFSNGETPESTNTKGDHFVGDYYVKCENQIRKEAQEIADKIKEGDYADFNEKDKQKLVEINELINAIIPDTDKDKEKIKKLQDDGKEIIRANTPIMKRAQEMLRDWEAGKPGVIDLWKRMNEWVYKGFDETYKRIGADFDKTYYESDIYLIGKEFVEAGLEQGVFYKKDDGSVWIDLTSEGLDEKLVLRKDGTSVYITQDLGLADQKYKDFPYDESLYVIADEQNYHMRVLELALKKLNKPYANSIRHLSYGMVDLPSGRMKSREGTVVDADDLVNEMMQVAAKHTQESGKVEGFTEAELKDLYETLGLGALKFYLLRVDPKKRMVFNPEESIDFHGFTGPFVQYTHARIRSIFRKAQASQASSESSIQPTEATSLFKLEKELLLMLEQWNTVLRQAAEEHNPSVIALYVFNLARTYNTFYGEHSVLNAETAEKKQFRLQLSELTANTIKKGMELLGIKVPERM
jgi:arginyl-tRNA synthetase